MLAVLIYPQWKLAERCFPELIIGRPHFARNADFYFSHNSVSASQDAVFPYGWLSALKTLQAEPANGHEQTALASGPNSAILADISGTKIRHETMLYSQPAQMGNFLKILLIGRSLRDATSTTWVPTGQLSSKSADKSVIPIFKGSADTLICKEEIPFKQP